MVSVPRSVTPVWLSTATSCGGVMIVTPLSSLSWVSRTPLPPNRSVPPLRRTPGRSVIIGIPVRVPCTSISLTSDSSASINSAALVATPTVPLFSPPPSRSWHDHGLAVEVTSAPCRRHLTELKASKRWGHDVSRDDFVGKLLQGIGGNRGLEVRAGD